MVCYWSGHYFKCSNFYQGWITYKTKKIFTCHFASINNAPLINMSNILWQVKTDQTSMGYILFFNFDRSSFPVRKYVCNTLIYCTFCTHVENKFKTKNNTFIWDPIYTSLLNRKESYAHAVSPFTHYYIVYPQFRLFFVIFTTLSQFFLFFFANQ